MVLGRVNLLHLVLNIRGVNPLLYVSAMCYAVPRERSHLEDEFPVAAERGVFKGLHYRHVRIRHVGVLAHEHN